MGTAAKLRIRAATALAALASTALFAQQSPTLPRAGTTAAPVVAPARDVPRLQNGKPDLSGLWANPYTPDMAAKGTVLDPTTRKALQLSGAALADAKPAAIGGGKRTFDLPYTEWGLKRWKAYDPVNDGDYAGSCLPFAAMSGV